MIWFTLIFQCACMIPQVQDKVCRMIAQVDFTKIEQKVYISSNTGDR